MGFSWRYRFAAVIGTSLLIVIAVVLADTHTVQTLLTSVPILSNLEPSLVQNDDVSDEVITTLVIVLAILWPLFKPRPRRILDTISLTQRRLFLAAAVLATIGYFDWSTRLPRVTLIGTMSILSMTLPLWFVYIRRQPQESTRAIIVGDDRSIIETLWETANVPILGLVSPSSVQPERSTARMPDGGVIIQRSDPIPRLGGLSRLDEVLIEHEIDTVLLGFERPDREEFFGALSTCHEHGVRAKVHRDHADSVLVSDTARGDLIDTDLVPWDWQDYVVKRVFDLFFAGTMLLVLSPILGCIAIAVRLDSPGPVFYSQTRTAAFGERFTIYKFRTMRVGDESRTPINDDENDRITGVGRYLRRTHLDEIPQLWSIFLGDMSVVGPRAAWTDEEEHLEAKTSEWRKRWFVKPGLTGLAQINGLTSTTPEQKLRYDIEYIRQQSFWFDLKIVVRQLFGVVLDVASLLKRAVQDWRR